MLSKILESIDNKIGGFILQMVRKTYENNEDLEKCLKHVKLQQVIVK